MEECSVLIASINITFNVYHSIFSYLEESVQNFSLKITADALFGAGRKINALGFPAAAVIVIVRGKDQMASNFPGNRGRALAKFVSNLFEAPSFFDASLDRDSVRECKVFAFVGFNKSIHK